jgi:hypothetical protein
LLLYFSNIQFPRLTAFFANTFCIRLNLSEIPTGCLFLQFAIAVYVVDVFRHIGTRGLEEFGDFLLRQPKCFTAKMYIYIAANCRLPDKL